MPGLSVAWLLCLPLAIVIGVSKYRERSSRRGLPLPPGPKYLPLIVQKLFHPSQENPWVTYQNWSKQYGVITIEEVDLIPMFSFVQVVILFRSTNWAARLSF